MKLSKARILSSENDASVKQSQNTNVEIKIKQPNHQQQNAYAWSAQDKSQNAHFTLPDQNSQFQYQLPTNNIAQERGITDLGNDLETLELKNKFLEMIVEMYSENLLKVNSYVVCKSSLLMNMIKLLTNCDKVDLVLDDYEIGCGCGTSTSKLLKMMIKQKN